MTTMLTFRSNSATCWRHNDRLSKDFSFEYGDCDMKQSAYTRTPLLSLRESQPKSRLRPKTTPVASKEALQTQNVIDFGLLFTPKRISYRVEKALKQTEQEKGVCFYKGKPSRMVVTNRGGIVVSDPISAVVRDNDFYCYQEEQLYQRSTSSHNSESASTEYTETTESLSLMPGVFENKSPKPRIFVRLRQLSVHERVIEWLYRSCNHPCKTLPLI